MQRSSREGIGLDCSGDFPSVSAAERHWEETPLSEKAARAFHRILAAHRSFLRNLPTPLHSYNFISTRAQSAYMIKQSSVSQLKQ